MEKSLLLRKTIFFAVLGFLIFPVLHILFYVPLGTLQWDPFLGVVILGASYQALISTVLTICGGLVSAFGLIVLKNRLSSFYFKTLLVLLVIPSFIPPLITVVLATGGLGLLPTGLSGVIFFHVLMNIGLIAVLFYFALTEKAGWGFKESLVAGVNRRKFIFKALLPELKDDISTLSFYLFVLFFFSFSIPLLVGGSVYGGVEVFIFEKIMMFGQWSEAIQYAFGLFLILLMLALLVKKRDSTFEQPQIEPALLARLGWGPLALFSAVPSLFLVYCLLGSLAEMFDWPSLFWWLSSARGTLIIGLLTGLNVFILLSLLSFSFLNQKSSKIITAMINPGWVLVGFSFLLLGSESQALSLFKVSLALSILYLPFLFRLSFAQRLKDIQLQVKLAQTFPISWMQIFLQVIWPQCIHTICFLSAIAAVWACGDFAISSIIISSPETSSLALDMKNLIVGYRLEQSLSLLFPLLLCCFIVFLVFQGLSYVSRRKFSA